MIHRNLMTLLMLSAALIGACTIKWETSDPWSRTPAPDNRPAPGQPDRSQPGGATRNADPQHTPEVVQSPRAWPVLLTTMAVPESIEEDFDEMGVEKGFIMTQGAIDPKNTGRWSHPIYTERWLDRVVPADFDGFITLNWEGKAIGVLHDGPSHPEFEQTVDEWARLIRFVREQRPRAYVGMYSLPIRQYWGQDEEWRRAALAYKPILDASSVIYPSVYDFYHRNPAGDHERFGNIVELALELAEGKPVILYTRHRYHPSNKVFPNRIIPRDEYVNHVRHLMNVEVDGQRPAGVVAWSNDMALLRAPREHEPGEKPNPALELLQKEMRPGESRIEYLERVMRRVFCLLNEAVRDMPCESIPPGSKPSVHGDGPVTGSRGG